MKSVFMWPNYGKFIYSKKTKQNSSLLNIRVTGVFFCCKHQNQNSTVRVNGPLMIELSKVKNTIYQSAEVQGALT